MTFEEITPAQLARERGLVDDEGRPAARGLAELLRAPLAAWGLMRRRDLLRHAKALLDAAGLGAASPELRRSLDWLVSLRECEEVVVASERLIAPGEPRWVPTGGGSAALLSAGALPEGIAWAPDLHPQDPVRRVAVSDADARAALQLADIREAPIEEWLRPAGYWRHVARRTGSDVVGADRLSLEGFWELLEGVLASDGAPLGPESRVRAVCGAPGGRFGRHTAERCEGRWSETPADGVWCAYRGGYNDAHWHPILISVQGERRRALDLFDHDEWRWALLARGHWSGAKEQHRRAHDEVRLGFPAPDQLRAALDVLGPRVGVWRWRIAEDAPDPLEMVR